MIEACRWQTYDVQNGAVICAVGGRVGFQRVQWVAHSGRYGYIQGTFN